MPDFRPGGAWRGNWREIVVLFRREMRTALRERNIVINSILIPVLLYPAMLWVAVTGLTFVKGQTQGYVSRVVVPEWPAGHAELRGRVERDKQFSLVEPGTSPADAARQQIKDGRLDALLEFLPPEGGAGSLDGNFSVRVVFDGSKDRSAMARDRLKGAVERHREDWLGREAAARGIPEGGWRVLTVTVQNVASPKQIGTFVLGRMLPIFFVIAVAMGSFQPAVDAVAGERERGTWETLMSTAAGRTNVAAAKYLYVACMGGMAGILNISALAVTMKPIFAPLAGEARNAIAFTVPLASVPVIALAAVLLAGFVAAGMLAFTSFARTFKEGQSAVTPFFMVLMIPALFLQSPGLEFSLTLACVPLVNVVMMVRAALSGLFPWLPIVVTVTTSIALIAVSVRAAAFVLQFEDVVMGSHEGGLQAFLKNHVFRRSGKRPATP